MLACVALAALIQDVRFTVEPFAGLHLSVNGIPVVVGSAFQYFDAKTGKGLYSSRWSPKEVSRMPDGSTRVRYGGDNGNVIGTHTYTPTAKGLQVRYEFRWRGEGEAKVENNLAQIWAPVVAHGEAYANALGLFNLERPVKGDWAARRLAGGSTFTFGAPLLDLKVSLRGGPAALYDARGHTQDWAKGTCALWLGQQLRVKPGQTTEIVAEWELTTHSALPRNSPTLILKGSHLQGAVVPRKERAIVPEPKTLVKSGGAVSLSQDGRTPTELTAELGTRLGRLWSLDEAVTLPVEGRFDSTLGSQCYAFEVTQNGVTLRFGDSAGRDYALDSLAQLAFSQNGRLVLPLASVTDGPVIGRRGIHFFSAKDALDFQQRWVARVLGPLRFNSAVVEVSRARWAAVDSEKHGNWVPLSDLQRLFSALKAEAIEPIPLVQSLGHMEWLLDGKHRNLAVHPDLPYTLDYRKKSARDLIQTVWEEVCQVLKPETIHVGLDEIAMRGATDDTTLPGRLWKAALVELKRVSDKSQAKLMLWGDMMLAKEEAPDAAHAKSLEEAKSFRNLVPRGAIVADWHYLPSRSPEKYSSLKLWPALGLSPVAASWHRSDNIIGHTQAARLLGAGTLQTTWAGYATDEAALLKETGQFAAHVVAACASWSGSTTPISSPQTVLRDLLYTPPAVVKTRPGLTWSSAEPRSETVRIGDIAFRLFAPQGLFSPLTSESSQRGQALTFELGTSCESLILATDCVAWQKEGDPVARVTVETDSGPIVRDILYGGDVRAPEDLRDTVRVMSQNGLSAVRIPIGLKNGTVKRVVVESNSLTAGLRVHGVTTF